MTDTRAEFGRVFAVYWPVLVAVLGIVWGLTAFALVRYRRRPGREPSRRSEHRAGETAYALALAAVSAGLVALTFDANREIVGLRGEPGLEVSVTAFQWSWRFVYPESGVAVGSTGEAPPTLVVPAGTPIRISLTSRDVIHAFWVPYLRFKRDAFPNRTTRFDVSFDRPGRFAGHCAEFCGLLHARMTFDVLALPPDEFEAWLAARSGAAQ